MRNLLYLLLFIAICSCEKIDNYDKISKDYQYTGSFLIPIGSSQIGLKESGKNLPPNWETNPIILSKLDSISFSDSIPFDFNYNIGNTDRIKRLIFTIATTNDFPAEIYFQAYIANGNMFVVDSLFDGKFQLHKATISLNGDVTPTVSEPQNIPVTKERIKKWEFSKYIVIKGYMENTDTTAYKYYDKLKIDVAAGVQVDFDFNLNTVK